MGDPSSLQTSSLMCHTKLLSSQTTTKKGKPGAPCSSPASTDLTVEPQKPESSTNLGLQGGSQAPGWEAPLAGGVAEPWQGVGLGPQRPGAAGCMQGCLGVQSLRLVASGSWGNLSEVQSQALPEACQPESASSKIPG